MRGSVAGINQRLCKFKDEARERERERALEPRGENKENHNNKGVRAGEKQRGRREAEEDNKPYENVKKEKAATAAADRVRREPARAPDLRDLWRGTQSSMERNYQSPARFRQPVPLSLSLSLAH